MTRIRAWYWKKEVTTPGSSDWDHSSPKISTLFRPLIGHCWSRRSIGLYRKSPAFWPRLNFCRTGGLTMSWSAMLPGKEESVPISTITMCSSFRGWVDVAGKFRCSRSSRRLWCRTPEHFRGSGPQKSGQYAGRSKSYLTGMVSTRR
jgi:hypothetical protein